MPGPRYTAETKQEFFDLLDRGGTIRAAAKAVGVREQAAYAWVRAAGLTMGRATARCYTSEEKAEFFRLLEERQNVSAVARELGFNRVTCYSWAHKAGTFTSEARRVNPRRARFLQLRADGLTRVEAASEVRADARSAADWDKGITIIHRGRIYPDGRVVRYPEPKLPDVPTTKTAVGGRVSLVRVEQVIHSRYLSLIEREQIRDHRRSGMSIRRIAADMGRSPSTISRELTRNTVSERGYMPHTAHRLSVERRRRPRTPKVLSNDELFGYVREKLAQRWSPEQISRRLRKEFPDSTDMRVCTETIYQAIYVHARGELKRDLARQLRRRRSARKPHRQPDARRPRFVDPMVLIDDRPAEIEDRAVPGHWEGDLIVGAGGSSAIATLVERSTRLVLLGHLGKERNADAVRDSLVDALTALPDLLRQSLTWDQGAEMSEHRSFSVATGMDVYFCDPGSPWQRGTNENTNGLLRDYFPKGTDLSRHGPDELARVAAELNSRPRKSLDWDTPAERISALLTTS
jgi:IS30 family transposase